MSSQTYSWKRDRLLWPIFVGGAAAVPAGSMLEPWLPPAYATAVGMFGAWTVAGIVLSFKPPIPNWSLPKWIAAGALGAIVAGGVVFLLGSG